MSYFLMLKDQQVEEIIKKDKKLNIILTRSNLHETQFFIEINNEIFKRRFLLKVIKTGVFLQIILEPEDSILTQMNIVHHHYPPSKEELTIPEHWDMVCTFTDEFHEIVETIGSEIFNIIKINCEKDKKLKLRYLFKKFNIRYMVIGKGINITKYFKN